MRMDMVSPCLFGLEMFLANVATKRVGWVVMPVLVHVLIFSFCKMITIVSALMQSRVFISFRARLRTSTFFIQWGWDFRLFELNSDFGIGWHFNRLSINDHLCPRFIYSWCISHILEHEFFCLGRLGRSGRKGKNGFEFLWATFEGVFFNFFGAKKNFF